MCVSQARTTGSALGSSGSGTCSGSTWSSSSRCTTATATPTSPAPARRPSISSTTRPTSDVTSTYPHFWMENPYMKVDTIAPDESFSRLDAGHVNTKVCSFGPLSKAGFYLAFQDQGTCVLLISMCTFYKKCASTTAGFALFPETLTGAEPTSLVIAPGTCIPNAMEVSVLLKLYCNGEGEGMVPVCACTCATGHEPAAKESQCHCEWGLAWGKGCGEALGHSYLRAPAPAFSLTRRSGSSSAVEAGKGRVGIRCREWGAKREMREKMRRDKDRKRKNEMKE
ncbi:hypothetical protein P7K49_040742 [Saguinus oedipus]|uniref:Eph LBD domain-containing protein n=1 Tax=Saguinus oedipus TaxID=9490 RepID=A0ABQ9TAM7_SAGOE|nr:hypothetical protein P7K49_040742 [Saguinus oedipus]